MSQITSERPEAPEPSEPGGPRQNGDHEGVDHERLDHERLDRLERDVRAYRISRDGWTFIVLGVAVAVLFAAIIAIGFAMQDDGDGGAAAGPAGMNVTATLSEYAIELSSSAVTPNSTITIVNNGTMEHNLGVEGTDLLSTNIPAGGTATLDLSSLEPGSYTIYCEIPGHASSGMTTALTISETATASGGDATAMGHTAEEHAAMTPEEGAAMDASMIESVAAFPAETAGIGNQVLEPTILPDGTKHFELTAAIVDWEVTPGNVVRAWAYNGMVPGPRINLEVGDKVEVQITNELPLGTDIHWHGVNTPNDQDGVAPITQDLVTSGTTYTYEFEAVEPAIAMYHAHAHGVEAVPNGMFGTMYIGHVPIPAGRTVSGIEIPADVKPVMDFPMVLNDAGVIGLTLNGKGFPATEPYVVENGDWVSVTYYNEGLQVHPMHLHAFPQIVYAKDGLPLDEPYAADTILVAPGERYTVLFHADRPGTWVWHCHILNHVESDVGMFGMVTALIVQ